MFADVVVNPAFDAKEFERVRDNLLTAITRRKDSPPTVANLAFTRLLYGQKHPYGWPMAGVEASIKKLTPADLRAFYDKYYRPNNAALLVAGDTTEKALRGKLEAAFAKWRAKGAAAPKLPAPEGAAPATRIFLVDKADAPQSSIRVGLVGIDRKNPDYFPVTVMNLILGGGFYRLDLNLREGKGWTYGARSTVDSRRAPGPISAGGEFVALHTADSVAEILKELASMRDADVTDVELARAKDQIIKSFPARFATRAQRRGAAGRAGGVRPAGQLHHRLHEEDRGGHQGRRPPRRAQVPRPEPPHHRRGRRPQDAGRAARQAGAGRGPRSRRQSAHQRAMILPAMTIAWRRIAAAHRGGPAGMRARSEPRRRRAPARAVPPPRCSC